MMMTSNTTFLRRERVAALPMPLSGCCLPPFEQAHVYGYDGCEVAPMCCGAEMNRHKPILAERFKTKLCKNYLDQGSCPYVFRCMFAHGEHELRTKAMNMADGLYTEEAIKAFKRMAYYAEKDRRAQAEEHETTAARREGRAYRHDPYAMHSLWKPVSAPRPAASSPTPPLPPPQCQTSPTPSSAYYSTASARSSSCNSGSTSPALMPKDVMTLGVSMIVA